LRFIWYRWLPIRASPSLHLEILTVLEKVPLDTDKAHKDPSWVDLHRHHLAPFTSEIWCGSMIDPNNIFLTFCSLPKFQEARKTWNSWWFRDDPCLLWEGSQCLFFLRGWTVKFWEGIVSLPIVGDKTEASHTSMKKNPPQFSSRMVAFERIDKKYLKLSS